MLMSFSLSPISLVSPRSPILSTRSRTASTRTSREVAVIGAGAAGLVAARELRRQGHQVVVFERNNKEGGTWIYDPQVESDPLSLDPSRTLLHTSLYDSLRTNLPREVMGFRDYPFVAKHGANHRDPRRFPGHQEVLHYLNDFVLHFRLRELIRYETQVVHVGLVEDGNWLVRYHHPREPNGVKSHAHDDFYDAVVVCNGHHTVPRVAKIPGIDVWPGKQVHSHNYRVPESFCDQVCISSNTMTGWRLSVGFQLQKNGESRCIKHIRRTGPLDQKLFVRNGKINIWSCKQWNTSLHSSRDKNGPVTR